jgi:CRISPR-associated endonuclease/helicase Cas3
MMDERWFRAAFRALTDNHPFRWQTELYKRFTAGDVPSACDIPTGLGKTSVIPVWVTALAQTCVGCSPSVPRRLVYIVNRRTVVDQATAVVEQMRARLLNPEGADWSAHAETLRSLANNLGDLAATKVTPPLGISTLRGELADNEEWKTDPARPAIIIGTIDMIGSKLLFSGYGDGRYHRAHHAGLVGQDVLIVHDEAHLTPAFSDLLRTIENEQRMAHERNADCEPRRVRVLELSATQRRGQRDAKPLTLTPEDEADRETGTIVKQRLDATKDLRLHDNSGTTDIVPKLVELARSHETTPSKVLIYVRSPEDAQKVAKQLKQELRDQANKRVALLTGTIRGHERDRLVNENPVYRALLNHQAAVAQTVYLVSTSAGEVGIDLDADHMVCDLTTLDSMIQRLGRVNRRGGEARAARVDVVWAETDEKPGDKATPIQKATATTLQILRRWFGVAGNAGLVVSPRHLRRLVGELTPDERMNAFSPKPTSPPLTDILLDAWSLSSVDTMPRRADELDRAADTDAWSLSSVDTMPGRPEVAAYLHGLTADPPETYVVWRKEVALFQKYAIREDALRDWFRACRIESRERLRDRTNRVKKALADLLKAHRKHQPNRDFPVVLLDERGQAEWPRLSRSSPPSQRAFQSDERGQAEWPRLSEIVENERNLRYRTVVLPVEVGGLDTHGMLDSKAVEPVPEIDVADGVHRQRWLHIRTAEGDQFQVLLSGESAASLPLKARYSERITLKEPPEGAEATGEEIDLLLVLSPVESAIEDPETARFRQFLTDHTGAIIRHADCLAERLGMDGRLKEALAHAAKWHDRGKDRPVWQRYACNPNGAEPLAKSTRYLHGRALGGYRHEFGSLLEATLGSDGNSPPDEIARHPERDLILHLIAAHHGWARPHFDPKAFDHERFSTQANEEAAIEVLQRFGRLQQRFGRWGLAWLESLLRCADMAASQPPGQQSEDDEQ